MGPETPINSDSTTLAVSKLCDDRSDWADYQPRLQNAMGLKGIWRHIEGTNTAPVLYAINNGIPILSNGKTPATEDQIESKESKILEFKKREYLARHILMSTTSTQLSNKIKGLPTADDMWRVIKDDTMSKSTLYLLDAEDQLSSMKLPDNTDPKTHLSELKAHFHLMLQRCDNLMKISSTMSESHFNIIIMSSLLESYQSTLQPITALERTNKLSGLQSNAMEADDMIAFIIEEAQHRVMNNDCMKSAESALTACTGKLAKPGRKTKQSLSQI